jgi:hypothetical protein
VVEYRSPNLSRVLHTNHPLAGEMREAYAARDQPNTIARLKSLMSRLMTGEPDLEAIKAALSSSDDPDHPVCRKLESKGSLPSIGGVTNFTTGSMISVLQQGSQLVDSWVSAGPPCLRGYTLVHLPAEC